MGKGLSKQGRQVAEKKQIMNKRHITSLISQNFGKFASHEFVKPIQNMINKTYVNLMGLDMNEFHAPSTYKSLNALLVTNNEREFKRVEGLVVENWCKRH